MKGRELCIYENSFASDSPIITEESLFSPKTSFSSSFSLKLCRQNRKNTLLFEYKIREDAVCTSTFMNLTLFLLAFGTDTAGIEKGHNPRFEVGTITATVCFCQT